MRGGWLVLCWGSVCRVWSLDWAVQVGPAADARRKWGGGACDCAVRPGAGCAERDGDDAVKGEGRIEGRRGGEWAWLVCFGEIDTELLPILDCLSLNRHGLGCKL